MEDDKCQYNPEEMWLKNDEQKPQKAWKIIIHLSLCSLSVIWVMVALKA